MQTLVLYLTTLAVFVSADVLGISLVIKPAFARHVGDLLAGTMQAAPAVAFYLLYVAGVLWFAARPALRAGKPLQALGPGAVLGLMCYGTYELTNMATLRGWAWEMVALDTAWGGLLTGGAALAGVLITRRVRPA
jgi:uncharacterized membrane protein